MMLTAEKWRIFDGLLRDEAWSLERLRYHAGRLLDDSAVEDKTILDIGCGRGAFSIFFALSGARSVTGIDPAGPGGTDDALNTLSDRIRALELTNCQFIPAPFESGAFESCSFDLLFLRYVINHLHEIEGDLLKNGRAREIYRRYFGEMFRIARPGARVIISDTSCVNAFAPLVKLGLRHPVAGLAEIEWETHQRPKTWIALMHESGFEFVSRSWYVPAPLRRLGWLFDNTLINYFTFSLYTLRFQRPHGC